VGVHEVLMPSRKGCLAERGDFHGAKVWWADEPDARALNTLFCDGHAQRVQVADTTPTIPTRYFFDGEADNDTVPFLSTPNGYLGDDLAGQ
jgi:prepilin-type processing-associated H-X9-DG protein